MKQFLKKRWHRVPVGIISALLAVCLIAGSTLAAIGVTETQTSTQTITPVPIASSIDAPDVDLPDVQVGECFSPVDGTVTVVIGNDGIGNWLHMEIVDAAGAYSSPPDMACFGVSLVSPAGDNPMGVELSMSGNTASWLTIANPSPIQLTAEGTYIFAEQIAGCAGMTAQDATVEVNFTLEDTA